ncbi:MAG: NAD(P)-dependent oxidoreductase [Negativicutes bacterium]
MQLERIYMSGVGGMLGEAFYEKFRLAYHLKCTDIDLNSNWLTFGDFRDYDEYRRDVIDFKPSFLFHIGAYTDLEYCEANPEEAYLTNTIAVENAVYIANELNIPLLYISSAGIFDGSKEFFDDWDIPNPLGVYARTKYQGELFVRENANRYYVCRAGWMMGGGPDKDKKFVNKIMKQILSGRKVLRIVDDKFGTPTYTRDFAENVKLLVSKGYYGVYNVVCNGLTSRVEVAKKIVEHLGLKKKIEIEIVDSNYFCEEYHAPRPSSEQLINRKLNLRRINIMRGWQVCLKEYIDECWSDLEIGV